MGSPSATHVTLTAFSLLLLVGISSGGTREDILQQYFSVLCHREKMTVKLNFNRTRHPEMSENLSELIWRGSLCIGDERTGECCSQLNMIQQSHIISVGYSKCEIEKRVFEAGFNFLAKIRYRGTPMFNGGIYHAECVVPFMESHIKAKMFLSQRKFKTSDVNFLKLSSKTPEPLPVRLGTRVYFAIAPTIDGMRERLHTYPSRCWVVPASRVENSMENERRYFIKNGCPVTADIMQPAVIEQKMAGKCCAEWSRVTLPITTDILPIIFANGTSSIIELQQDGISIVCEAIVCSGQQMAGFQDAPTCPRAAAFCAPNGERRLPGDVQSYVGKALRVQLNGALRLLPADPDDPSNEPLIAVDDINTNPSDTNGGPVDCTAECSIEVEKAVRKLEVREEECYSSEGIAIYIVIVIAIISFGFGVAFVAILWIIHIKTDPQRKIRCVDNGCRAVPNGLQREPIVRPANHGNALARALNERQRLVSNRPSP